MDTLKEIPGQTQPETQTYKEALDQEHIRFGQVIQFDEKYYPKQERYIIFDPQTEDDKVTAAKIVKGKDPDPGSFMLAFPGGHPAESIEAVFDKSYSLDEICEAASRYVSGFPEASRAVFLENLKGILKQGEGKSRRLPEKSLRPQR